MATPAKVAKPEAKNGENADDQAGKKLQIYGDSFKNVAHYLVSIWLLNFTFERQKISSNSFDE